MKKFKKGYMAGVYDLFHVGHLNLINRAKEQCEYLVVGVLTDELVVHFKKKLPYIPFEERLRIVQSIKGVDEAVPVTLENIGKMSSWKRIQFDVQFSGSDYENAPDWLEDKRRLEEVGATIVFLPYTKDTSSTQIKRAIRQRGATEKLFLFGSGVLGQKFLGFLNQTDTEGRYDVLGFLDNDRNKALSIVMRTIVFPPEYVNQYVDQTGDQDGVTVVITTMFVNEIEKQLKDLTIKKIIPFYEFPEYMDYAFQNGESLVEATAFVPADLGKCEELKKLLADDPSRELVDAIMAKRKKRDRNYETLYSPEQYFPQDIITLEEEEIFIDAGAFTGDTAEILLQKRNDVKEIICFEPCDANYDKLVRNVGHLGNVTIRREGLGSTPSRKKMISDMGAGSTISELGDSEIVINTIDALNKSCSFIKMDIEGAEGDALEGARETIIRCKPKLAISVYHKPDDICDLAFQIRSMVPEYRFYLRHHGKNQYETVLYAVI